MTIFKCSHLWWRRLAAQRQLNAGALLQTFTSPTIPKAFLDSNGLIVMSFKKVTDKETKKN